MLSAEEINSLLLPEFEPAPSSPWPRHYIDYTTGTLWIRKHQKYVTGFYVFGNMFITFMYHKKKK